MADFALMPGTCLACGTAGAVPLPEHLSSACRRSRSLTPRELAVFRLLGSGFDNREIARELAISERTVKRYVTAILTKLELRSRLQAGLCALLLSCACASGEAGWPEGLMAPIAAVGEDI